MHTSDDMGYMVLDTSSIVVYLDVDEETRRRRLSVRYDGGSVDDSLERRLQADKKDFEFFDSIDWNENPYGFVRLCNNIEVDEFLKKILS
jgi:cytidylate kinase